MAKSDKVEEAFAARMSQIGGGEALMIRIACGCWAIALLIPALSWADRQQEADSHFDRGMEAFWKQDYNGAIACFNEAIRLEPNDAKCYRGRANARVMRNQWNVGRGKDGKWYLVPADAKQRKQDLEQALADYDRAIRLEPDNALTYYDRGRAYVHEEDYDRAIADFGQAIRLDPKNRAVYLYERGWIYHMHKPDCDRAISDFSEVIHLDPDYVQAYADRAEAYAAKNENDRALADYTKAIELAAKKDSAAYDNLYESTLFQARGIFYRRNKNCDLAIADLSQAIRLAQRRTYAYYERGFAYAAKKDYGLAIDDYREGINLYPNHPLSYYGFAWLLATCPKDEFRNGDKAIEYAKKGLEASAGWLDQIGFNVLAAAYAEKGNFQQAIQCMQKALKEPGGLSKEEMQSRLKLYEQSKPCRSPGVLSGL